MNQLVIEPNNRILNDDILLDIFNYIHIKDLYRWQWVSKQFSESIGHSFIIRKYLIVSRNDRFNCIANCNGCYLRYFARLNSSKEPIDTHNNNIEFLVHFDTNYHDWYYMSRSLDKLSRIFIKCSQIQYLALKRCYLDEQTFEILDQNLNQLKYLHLSECYLAINRLQDLSPRIESLLKRLNNLNLYGKCKNEDQEIVSFALMFRCLSILRISLEDESAINHMLRQLPLTLKILGIDTDIDIDFTDNDFNDNRCSHLESISIHTLIISNEALNNIILSMNLKEISFNCIEINEQFLMRIENRWKGLKYLGINCCNFIGDFNGMQRIQSSLKHLFFWKIGLNPNQLKSVMKSFQNIKSIFLYIEETKIRCIADELKQNCKLCFYSCYEIFPRLDSLKELSIFFDDIRLSFIRCLKDFPNLRLLKIMNLYKHADQEVIDSYEEHLSDIMVYLINTCIENPKRCFRLKLAEKSTKLPNSLKIPKNLLIEKGKLY